MSSLDSSEHSRSRRLFRGAIGVVAIIAAVLGFGIGNVFEGVVALVVGLLFIASACFRCPNTRR